MQITDAQTHLWGANSSLRPWRPEGPSLAHGPAYDTEQLLSQMSSAGVHRAVLVPPSWEGDRNEICLAAARAHPNRFVVMGRLPSDGPSDPGIVDAWLDEPGMRGVRLTFGVGIPTSRLTDQSMDWFWRAAEAAGVPVMIFAPAATEAVGLIAKAHSRLRLVIDHLNITPTARGDEIDAAILKTLELANLPNVAVKASALPSLVDEPYPYPSLHDRIHQVVAAFGPKRVFWGSDVTRFRGNYRESITLFTRELQFLSDNDLKWIMGQGVSDWIQWP